MQRDGGLELRRVRIHGHEIGFYAAGEGPVMVLLHGIAGSARTWREVLPRLALRFTVIAPDLMGHGASAKLRGDYSLGAHASAVRDLLVALGHDHATVVGHSLGGGVAMQFAYQFPERLERLVLVGSGGLGQEVSPLLRALTLPGAEYLLPLGCQPRLQRAALAATGWIGRLGVRPSPAVEEIWEGYVSLGSPEGRQAFLHTLRAVVDVAGQRVSASDRLYLTRAVPTLLVWGEDDRIIPAAHGRAAHRAMPGSRLEVYAGVGHFPHRERPDRFVADLLRFVDATAPATFAAGEWRAMVRAQPRRRAAAGRGA
ncbi:MAG TPA: alpha/beta fold hydrolase [Candidatus Dormibacteraeota bacterium]|nr:alpha/beta fold hydrolase [Candidatus Dormibacteraeota bacterium]